MLELRVSRWVYESMDLDLRIDLKDLTETLATAGGLDWEFSFYWIKLTEENWLIANIKWPDAVQYLKVAT